MTMDTMRQWIQYTMDTMRQWIQWQWIQYDNELNVYNDIVTMRTMHCNNEMDTMPQWVQWQRVQYDNEYNDNGHNASNELATMEPMNTMIGPAKSPLYTMRLFSDILSYNVHHCTRPASALGSRPCWAPCCSAAAAASLPGCPTLAARFTGLPVI